MPKVSSLKTKADYRGPGCKGQYYTVDLEMEWEGPVLHYKYRILNKLELKDVIAWEVAAEPGGKPDRFGRLKILHIIKLRTKKELWEFAIPPEVFENWLYWIIRSLVKHAKISLKEEEIKQSPLSAKHKLKTGLFRNLSVFDRTHQLYVNAISILQSPEAQKKLPSELKEGEGGLKIGDFGKKIGSGGSNTMIHEIMRKLDSIKSSEQLSNKPVVVKWIALKGSHISILEEMLKDMIKEARILALLGKHQNIVGLIDTALTDTQLCLFMEKGICDLAHLDQNTLTKDLVLKYARDIFTGIAHMHQCRVYHLDMKPQNVIITDEGFAKIIDFGLARSATLHSKEERFDAPLKGWMEMGTIGYISPEAWDWKLKNITSEIDLAKRDSYAVGMTIIDGLLGPFLGMEAVKAQHGEGQQLVLDRIKEWKKRLSDKKISEDLRKQGLAELAEAVIGLIEEDPQKRWTVERAAEFLPVDRRELRRKHLSESQEALNTFIKQSKNWPRQ